MNAELVVNEGAQPATIRLRLPTVIGRGKNVSVRVAASRVSRQHCELFEENGQLMVRDLDSSNGTFVNDDRIDGPSSLADHDRLKVANVQFRVQCGDSQNDISVGDQSADDATVSATHGEDGSQSAVLEYEETSDGSFIGIQDDDAKNDPPAGQDSALRSFLDGLGQE